MRVEREWLRALIFQSDQDRTHALGHQVQRFTQDSAILPDVWLSAGMFYCRDERARVDLLLTPYQENSPSVLAAAVRRRLDSLATVVEPSHQVRDVHVPRRAPVLLDAVEQRRVLLKPTASIAVNQTNVAAALTLEELIAAVLPLSKWWDRNLAENEKKRSSEEQKRADAQIAWLQRIVGVIALCSRAESEPEKDISRRDRAAAYMSLDETQRLRRASRFDAERFAQFVKETAQHQAEFKELVKLAEKAGRAERDSLAGSPDRNSARALAVDDPLMWSVGLNRASFVSIERSVPTTKADAVRRLFDVKCDKLCWAVVDSGIDAQHPAFLDADGASRVQRAYDFTQLRSLVSLDSTPASGPGANYRRGDTEASDRQAKRVREGLRRGRFLDWGALTPLLEIPLDDRTRAPRNDHGTHVAGILAARQVKDISKLEGMCPDIKLCDLRVLDGDGRGDEFSVIAALQFIRYLNANSDRQLIHGVNLSLSLIHDVENYACGRTPVCEECERLINSGVVVVVAAGNRGYETVLTSAGELSGYRDISITDPGNAEGVITVGSTHRFEPHTYGVSYFSSRGPTGDGRVKPDVLAPGEKIESTVLGNSYAAKDGTSMAAPHVSGIAALLMARYSEFMGQPVRIKKIIRESAMDLGREKYFQGAGMVDALRALQSV